MAKAEATKKPKTPSKTEVIANIATATDLSKKQVQAVIDALLDEIKKNLSNKGPGVFAIPGLVKIAKKKVAARPAQKGWINPFTKQPEDRPAKAAYSKVTVRPLKNLKDMAK